MTAAIPVGQAGLLAWLRRVPKKVLMLSLLFPVLIVAWIPVLSGGSAGTPTPTPTPQGVAAPAPTDMPPAAPGGEMAPRSTSEVASGFGAEALGRRVARITDPLHLQWEPTADGDPFADGGPASRVAAARTAEDLLRPTGVFLSATAPPVAVIGGRPYRRGDIVEGRVIEAIEEGRVVFRDGDRLFTAAILETVLGARQ